MTAAVRQAGPADVDTCVALLGAQLAEHDLGSGDDRPAIEGALANPSLGAMFLAEEAGTAVAVAYVGWFWSIDLRLARRALRDPLAPRRRPRLARPRRRRIRRPRPRLRRRRSRGRGLPRARRRPLPPHRLPPPPPPPLRQAPLRDTLPPLQPCEITGPKGPAGRGPRKRPRRAENSRSMDATQLRGRPRAPRSTRSRAPLGWEQRVTPARDPSSLTLPGMTVRSRWCRTFGVVVASRVRETRPSAPLAVPARRGAGRGRGGP